MPCCPVLCWCCRHGGVQVSPSRPIQRLHEACLRPTDLMPILKSKRATCKLPCRTYMSRCCCRETLVFEVIEPCPVFALVCDTVGVRRASSPSSLCHSYCSCQLDCCKGERTLKVAVVATAAGPDAVGAVLVRGAAAERLPQEVPLLLLLLMPLPLLLVTLLLTIMRHKSITCPKNSTRIIYEISRFELFQIDFKK